MVSFSCGRIACKSGCRRFGSLPDIRVEQPHPNGRGTLQNRNFVASEALGEGVTCLFYTPSPTQQNKKVLMRWAQFDAARM